MRPGPRFGSVDQLRTKRKEVRRGNSVVIVEPNNRTIIPENNRVVIWRDENDRIRRWGNVRVERRGGERYTIVRRGPVEVVTITDAGGRLLRRFRRGPDGREILLIDNRPRISVVGRPNDRRRCPARPGCAGRHHPARALHRRRRRRSAGLSLRSARFTPDHAAQRAYTLDEVRYNENSATGCAASTSTR